MTYVVWRLHRNQVYVAAAAIVAVTVVLAITGVVMDHDYHRALRECAATGTCANLDGQLFQGDGLIIDLVNASVVVPVLLGLFWGAPLVAKEFEDGTNILAWTQSVTRRRWMSANLGWVLGAAAAWGTALTLLVTWWRSPENALYGRFSAFDIQGVAPVAYCLFAVALGIAVGTWLRRLLPALATTLTLTAGLRVAVGLWLRPHLMTPIRSVFGLINDQSGAPATAWILARRVIDPSGHVADTTSITFLPSSCRVAAPSKDPITCLAQLGYHRLVTYQPDGRFWTFQAIESGIFLALAAALVAVAYRTVLRRDA